MSLLRSRTFFLCGILGATLASVATQATASTESELNTRWRGAWTVTGIETLSDCGGNYTNNAVRERRVSSKGDYRFDAGEIATVYKINMKRKEVEVLIDLAEPILVDRREGPFTLYDERGCKVELQIRFPRNFDARSTEQIDRLIASLLERYNDRSAAEDSPNWNARLREPFPAGYEDTLADYERWRVDETNAEIAAKIGHHVEEAARLVDRLDDDPEYLAGFAAGVDSARDSSLDRNCDHLLSMSASSFVKSVANKDERAYRDGYREGQELVFFLELARRLPRCFLPVPF